jgi:hypothetical protein
MISPILPTHDADTIGLELGIFIARQSHHYRVSRDAVIAAIREALPSQPSQSSQAPAARTSVPATSDVQAEVAAPQPSAKITIVDVQVEDEAGNSAGFFMQVDDPEPQPTSTPAVQEHIDDTVSNGLVERPTSPPGAEGSAVPAPITEAPKPLPDEEHRPAEAKTSDQADGGAVSAVKGKARLENADGVELPPSEPSKPKRVSNRQRVRECHEAHPDWTAAQIATELDMGAQQVRVVASHISLALPKPPARPQEPVERAGPPTPRPEPKQPPAIASAEPFDNDEPAPVVRKVTKAPTGRFYLRDKVTGHFVHQSLQPASRGDGPMMTSDRKWAWFDNMDRYRGAKRQWPQLAEMRKEAVQA